MVPVSPPLLLLPQPSAAERRQPMTDMTGFLMQSPSPNERPIPEGILMTPREDGTAFPVHRMLKKSGASCAFLVDVEVYVCLLYVQLSCWLLPRIHE